ncbi:unnamed protein product [Acanthoscelides obtectus]|uniref:Uncharacterized protein n=2 Tax=Acanthoscelides obtectus TaxID=200917 RepID=A0A9P0LFM1_ACAOB|nr:unnamed protein product [Acanthoscelides obtectus]CAK1624370.1 Equilibrative nucleoside transporter 3 [Acanthoscelides obtectus]
MLPMTFFVVANDYWMYKFRNTNYTNWDPLHRTSIQIYFSSILSTAKAVPVMIVSLLAAKYIHKLHLRPRLLYSTLVICAVFLSLTIFVVIDTDDWQVMFLIVVVALMTIQSMAGVIFRISHSRLLARFPIIYQKFDMYGSGCSSLFSIFLQILSLAIGKDPQSSALIFFVSGTTVIGIAFLLGLVSDHLQFYRYYVGDSSEDIKHPPKTFKQLLQAGYCIRHIIIQLFFVLVCMTCTGPVTYLVVSEYYGNGNPWNEKYFVPVVTFLIHDLVGLVTKYFARPLMTRKNAKWFTLMVILSKLTFVPLYFLCNAPTGSKRKIPILLPHDWQYITIVFTDSLCMMTLSGICMLSTSKLTEGDKQKTEDSFIVISIMLGILLAVTSPLGSLSVKLL